MRRLYHAVLITSLLVADHHMAEARALGDWLNGVRPLDTKDGLVIPVSAPSGAVDRPVPGQSGDTINIRDFKLSSDMDDTASFTRALTAATNTRTPLHGNLGSRVYIPCGKYILTSRLVITLAQNSAIALVGGSASCTELQWNIANGGIDFELPQQADESPSRNEAAGMPGAALDIEHLSLVNNAPGNIFTGTALRIAQPIPKHSISSGMPDQQISDVRWYSFAPGHGVQGQAWKVGIELTGLQNVHLDHITGRQWGTTQALGTPDSVGLHIVSVGDAHDYFTQQFFITNYAQQGAWRGIGIDGHNLQGLYAENLFLLQNAYSIDWEAPNSDASASFTLNNGSFNGLYAGILLKNVRQVMISNVEILNGGANRSIGKLARDYYGIYDKDADNVMITNNVLIPACARCSKGTDLIDPNHRGYGIFIEGHGTYDNQTSVIHGNSISYGDVGIHAAGGQTLVTGNAISNLTAIPTEDGSSASGFPDHPMFQDNQWGYKSYSQTNSVDTGTSITAPLKSGSSGSSNLTHDSTVLNCTGTLDEITWRLPAVPKPWQPFHITSTCIIRKLTLTPDPGTARTIIVGAPVGISPTTPLTFKYDAGDDRWLRF